MTAEWRSTTVCSGKKEGGRGEVRVVRLTDSPSVKAERNIVYVFFFFSYSISLCHIERH